MCEFTLCLQLRDSLDATFRGGVYEGAEWIGDWGLAVMQSLYDYRCPYPRTLIWQIAHNSIQSIIMSCPCEGMAEQILVNPEAFVRTTLILAARCPASQEPEQRVVYYH